MPEKPSDRSSRREWFARAAALSAAFAGALPAAEPPEPPPAATCPASGGVPPSGASLPEIAQIASGPDHVLRATISVEDEIRSLWMSQNNPADPFKAVPPPLCREGHPMRFFAGAPTGGKRVWPVAK